MATLYASGANWNTAGHWGTTSGASDGSVPTSADGVIFDAASVSMQIDTAAVCASINSTGYTATLTQNASQTLTVSGTTTWAAGTFTGSAAAISTVAFSLSGGTWTNTSGTMTVSGDFTRTSGTFTHNSGTVNFTGGDTTLTCTSSFRVITVNKTAQTNSLTLGAALTTTSTITVTTGILCLCGYNITPGSTFTISSGATLRLQGVETITTTQPTLSVGCIVVYNGDNVANTKTLKNWTYKNLTINDDKANKSTFKFAETHTGMTAFKVTSGTFDHANGDYALGCTSMTVDGGTFSGGTTTLDVNGAFLMSSGAFTATSGSWTQTVSVTISGGTFTHNSGLLKFDGTTTAVNTGTAMFNNVEVAIGVSTLTVTDTMDVNGNLTLTSYAAISTGTISVAGNCTSADATANGTATILLDGGGDQTLGSVGGTGVFPKIAINKSGGTLTVEDVFVTPGNGVTSWAYTAGTVNCTRTVTFGAGGQTAYTIDSGAMSFNHVTLNIAQAITVTGTMDVNGNLSIGSDISAINTGTISVAGNITTVATIITGTCTILIDGGGNQTLGASGGTGYITGITINKGGGTLTIQDTIVVRATSGSPAWTYTAGTVDAGTSTIQFGNGGTFSYDITPGAMSFNNVVLNTVSTFTFTGTMDVNGDFTITGMGTMTGGTITVAGNIVLNDTGVSGTTAVTWDGSGSKTLTAVTGTGELPDGTFTINGTGTLSLASNFALDATGQDLTLAAGTLDLAGYNLTVTDTFTVASGATLKLKGSETITAGTKTYNSAMTLEYYDAAVTAVVSNFGTTLPNVKFFGGKTHNFTASGTFTSTGTWQVSGGMSKAILRSTVDGTTWNLNFTGTNNLGANVDVKNSDATPGDTMTVVGSTNSGGNTEWDFGSATFKPWWNEQTLVYAGD